MPETSADAEEVGSLAEEAAKLFAAVISQGKSDSAEQASCSPKPASASGDGHVAESCPHGWCPACQGIEFIREHPEVVAQVVSAGAELLRALKSAVDVAARPRED